MEVNEKSVNEPKFFPKAHAQRGNKWFDIVDACCMKIIKKSETGDNWTKILEREICLTKIKYPFLSEKQIKGRALQKLGIPNLMGDIVRSGAHKVTGDIARELKLLIPKKEPRVPLPFKFYRKPHIVTVKKEMETSQVTRQRNSLLQNSSKKSQPSDSLIDENINLSFRNSKAMCAAKRRPRKLLEFTKNLFHNETQETNKSASSNEFGTPSKVPKMAQDIVEENIIDYKGYFTGSPSEISPIDNGDNTNGKVDKSHRELMEESENIIFSQLSETSRECVLTYSAEMTPGKRIAIEVDDDNQIQSLALQNLSGFTQNLYSGESPILIQTPIRKLEQNKFLLQNIPESFNKKNQLDAASNIQRNFEDGVKNNCDVIDEQAHSTNNQDYTEYIVLSSESLVPSDVSTGVEKMATHLNFLMNDFKKENREIVSPQNHLITRGNTAQRCHILGHIRQPPKPVFKPLKNEKTFFPSTVSDFSCNEITTPSGIKKFVQSLSSHLGMENLHRRFQVPNNVSNGPLIDDLMLDLTFKSFQHLAYSPIISGSQLKTNEKLRNSDSTSSLPSIFLENTQIPQLEVILENDVKKGQNPSVHVSQEIIPPDVIEILTSPEDISGELTPTLPQLEYSIDPEEGSLSLSSVTHQLPDEEKKIPLEIDFLKNPKYSWRCRRNTSNSKNRLSHMYGINFSKSLPLISSNDDQEVPEDNDLKASDVVKSIYQQGLSGSKNRLLGEDINFSHESSQDSQIILSTAGKGIFRENIYVAIEHQLTSAENFTHLTHSTSSTENSNPWLNVTSQDFSQGDSLHNASAITQDSGQASKDSLASQYSFISVTSEDDNCNNGDDENVINHFLSISQMLKVKLSTIKKNIERITHQLQSEI